MPIPILAESVRLGGCFWQIRSDIPGESKEKGKEPRHVDVMIRVFSVLFEELICTHLAVEDSTRIPGSFVDERQCGRRKLSGVDRGQQVSSFRLDR